MGDETNQNITPEESLKDSQDTQKIEVPEEVEEAKAPDREPEATMTVTSGGGTSSVNNVTVIPAADTVDKDTWLNKNIAPLLAIMILIASFGFFAYILSFDFSDESKLKDVIILLIGIVSTLVTTVIAYYFGSSQGSSAKSKFIHKMNNK